MKKMMLIAFCASLISTAAEATPRGRAQRARIRQGVKSGELTRGETQSMVNQQRRIRKMERKAASDGEVTAREIKKIDDARDRASQQILQQKHDEQSR